MTDKEFYFMAQNKEGEIGQVTNMNWSPDTNMNQIEVLFEDERRAYYRREDLILEQKGEL